MWYVKKFGPVLVLALALVLAPTLTQAKNSPTYPQLQQNGGTAAVGDKDGGGTIGDADRVAPSSWKNPRATRIEQTKIINDKNSNSTKTLSVGERDRWIFNLGDYWVIVRLWMPR